MQKIKLWISRGEIGFGTLLIVLSMVIHFRSLVCDVNNSACGYWEGTYAVWFLIFGASFIASGLILKTQGIKSHLGHILIFYGLFLGLTLQ